MIAQLVKNHRLAMEVAKVRDIVRWSRSGPVETIQLGN